MKNFLNMSFFMFIVTVFVGCGLIVSSPSSQNTQDVQGNHIQGSSNEQPTTNPALEASSDEKAYIASLVAVSGNKNSDVVVIYLQGGPTTQFNPDPIGLLIKNVPNPQPSAQYKVLSNAMLVSFRQHQTQHADLYAKPVDFETIKQYGAKSTKTLSDVVAHYHILGKRVYIVGTSYGAFLAQDLIEYTNKNDLLQPEGYLIMVGRLDMNEGVWKPFSLGHSLEFIDGVTLGKVKTDNAVLDANMYKLAAGFGHKRYTQLLANVSLDNVLYVYGEKDQAVGRLSDDEVAFLKSKDAKVVKVDGAGHSQTIFKSLWSSIDVLLANEVGQQ